VATASPDSSMRPRTLLPIVMLRGEPAYRVQPGLGRVVGRGSREMRIACCAVFCTTACLSLRAAYQELFVMAAP